jgi:hypothetical protein
VFAAEQLRLPLYAWQVETLEAVAQGRRTALRAANGSGKTAAIVAPLILWHLWRYPKGRVAVTSGSWLQVLSQLWPAMTRHASNPLFAGWQWTQTRIQTPQGGFAEGFSTNSPGRAEGWHNMPDAPVMYIVDEAKSVPDGIFTAIDRCTLARQLYCSSPGPAQGQFYRCFREESSLFYTVHVTAFDCPHIPKERIDRIVTKWGKDHWLTRSMIYGDFAEAEDNLLLTPDTLAKALASPPPHQPNPFKTAFIDVAAGRDENVIAIRDGNAVRVLRAWKESNTTQTVRESIRLLTAEGIDPSAVWVDAPGIGIAMINQYRDEGWQVNEYWGGAPGSDPTRYASLITETWVEGCVSIANGSIRLDSSDPELFRQLTTRRTQWDARGRIRLEPKEEMAAHGLHSPDRADAVLGAIWTASQTAGIWTGHGTAPQTGHPTVTITPYSFAPF